MQGYRKNENELIKHREEPKDLHEEYAGDSKAPTEVGNSEAPTDVEEVDGIMVDMDEIVRQLSMSKSSLTELATKDALVLLGETGAGKTTTMKFLTSHKLVLKEIKTEGKDEWGDSVQISNKVIDEAKLNPNDRNKIGHTLASETYSIHCANLKGNTILCDTPGFFDTKDAARGGVQTNVGNAVLIYNALKASKTVRPVVLFSAKNFLQARAGQALRLIRSLLDFLPLELAKKHVTVLFTHVEPGKNSLWISKRLYSLRSDTLSGFCRSHRLHDPHKLEICDRNEDIAAKLCAHCQQPFSHDTKKSIAKCSRCPRYYVCDHFPCNNLTKVESDCKEFIGCIRDRLRQEMKDRATIDPVDGNHQDLLVTIMERDPLTDLKRISCPIDQSARLQLDSMSKRLGGRVANYLYDEKFSKAAEYLNKSKALLDIPLESLKKAHQQNSAFVDKRIKDMVVAVRLSMRNQNYQKINKILHLCASAKTHMSPFAKDAFTKSDNVVDDVAKHVLSLVNQIEGTCSLVVEEKPRHQESKGLSRTKWKKSSFGNLAILLAELKNAAAYLQICLPGIKIGHLKQEYKKVSSAVKAAIQTKMHGYDKNKKMLLESLSKSCSHKDIKRSFEDIAHILNDLSHVQDIHKKMEAPCSKHMVNCYETFVRDVEEIVRRSYNYLAEGFDNMEKLIDKKEKHKQLKKKMNVWEKRKADIKTKTGLLKENAHGSSKEYLEPTEYSPIVMRRHLDLLKCGSQCIQLHPHIKQNNQKSALLVSLKTTTPPVQPQIVEETKELSILALHMQHRIKTMISGFNVRMVSEIGENAFSVVGKLVKLVLRCGQIDTDISHSATACADHCVQLALKEVIEPLRETTLEIKSTTKNTTEQYKKAGKLVQAISLAATFDTILPALETNFKNEEKEQREANTEFETTGSAPAGVELKARVQNPTNSKTSLAQDAFEEILDICKLNLGEEVKTLSQVSALIQSIVSSRCKTIVDKAIKALDLFIDFTKDVTTSDRNSRGKAMCDLLTDLNSFQHVYSSLDSKTQAVLKDFIKRVGNKLPTVLNGINEKPHNVIVKYSEATMIKKIAEIASKLLTEFTFTEQGFSKVILTSLTKTKNDGARLTKKIVHAAKDKIQNATKELKNFMESKVQDLYDTKTCKLSSRFNEIRPQLEECKSFHYFFKRCETGLSKLSSKYLQSLQEKLVGLADRIVNCLRCNYGDNDFGTETRTLLSILAKMKEYRSFLATANPVRDIDQIYKDSSKEMSDKMSQTDERVKELLFSREYEEVDSILDGLLRTDPVHRKCVSEVRKHLKTLKDTWTKNYGVLQRSLIKLRVNTLTEFSYAKLLDLKELVDQIKGAFILEMHTTSNALSKKLEKKEMNMDRNLTKNKTTNDDSFATKCEEHFRKLFKRLLSGVEENIRRGRHVFADDLWCCCNYFEAWGYETELSVFKKKHIDTIPETLLSDFCVAIGVEKAFGQTSSRRTGKRESRFEKAGLTNTSNDNSRKEYKDKAENKPASKLDNRLIQECQDPSYFKAQYRQASQLDNELIQLCRNPIINSGAKSNISQIKSMFNSSPRPDPNGQDNTGKSAFHHAVANRDIKLAELLIEMGADVQLSENFGAGDTPLMVAIKTTRTLEHKHARATPKHKHHQGSKKVRRSKKKRCRNKPANRLQGLMNHFQKGLRFSTFPRPFPHPLSSHSPHPPSSRPPHPPFHSGKGKDDEVEEVEMKEFSANDKTEMIDEEKYYELVVLLLKHRADPRRNSMYDESPLQWAILNRKERIVKLFSDAGRPANQKEQKKKRHRRDRSRDRFLSRNARAILDAIEKGIFETDPERARRTIQSIDAIDKHECFGIPCRTLKSKVKVILVKYTDAVFLAIRYLMNDQQYEKADCAVQDLSTLAEVCGFEKLMMQMLENKNIMNQLREQVVYDNFRWTFRDDEERKKSAKSFAAFLEDKQFHSPILYQQTVSKLLSERVLPVVKKIDSEMRDNNLPNNLEEVYVALNTYSEAMLSLNNNSVKDIFKPQLEDLTSNVISTIYRVYNVTARGSKNMEILSKVLPLCKSFRDLLNGNTYLEKIRLKMDSNWTCFVRGVESLDLQFKERLKLYKEGKKTLQSFDFENAKISIPILVQKLQRVQDGDLVNRQNTNSNEAIEVGVGLDKTSEISGLRQIVAGLCTKMDQAVKKLITDHNQKLLMEDGNDVKMKEDKATLFRKILLIEENIRLISCSQDIGAIAVELRKSALTNTKSMQDILTRTYNKLQADAKAAATRGNYLEMEGRMRALTVFETKLRHVLTTVKEKPASAYVIRILKKEINSEFNAFWKSHFYSQPGIQTVTRHLLKVQKRYGKNITDKKVHEFLKEKLSAFLETAKSKGISMGALGYELKKRSNAPTGGELVDKYPQFKFVVIEHINKVTAEVTPKHALDELEKNNETIDSAERKVLESKYNKYITCYTNYLDKFLKSGKKRDTSQLVNEICEKARTLSLNVNREWNLVQDEMPEFLAKIFCVWSIEESKGLGNIQNLNQLKKPHPVQVLTILRFLGIGGKKHSSLLSKVLNATGLSWEESIESHLCEVVTGGGKSILLGILSTVLALLDCDVYCACYSKILSERDEKAFRYFWKIFKVRDKIKYSQLGSLANSYINEGGNVRDLTAKLMKTKKTRLERVSDSKSSKRKVLLFDEVDVFFDKDFLGNTYGALATVEISAMYELMSYVWKNRATVNDGMIQNQLSYTTIKDTYGNKCASHLAQTLVQDVKTADHHDSYEVTDDGKIGYPEHGTICISTYYGYITAFCYFKELEKPQPLVNRAYAKSRCSELQFGCGRYSYAEVPKNFDLILGVTGTLSTMQSFEKEIVENDYGIKAKTITPSIYGKQDLKYSKESNLLVTEDENSFFQELQKAIIKNLEYKLWKHDEKGNRMTNPPPLQIKRAVLVFFRDRKAMSKFACSAQCATLKPIAVDEEGHNNLQTVDETEPNIDAAVTKATTMGAVTLFPRVFGRGLDFRCHEPAMDEVGVHVIQAFFATTEAEEVQIKGRTARMGNKGSFEIIALQDDLVQDFKISIEDIKDAKDGVLKTNSGNPFEQRGGVYNFLHKARLDEYQNNIAARQSSVQNSKKTHAKSMDYLVSLKEGGLVRVARNKLFALNGM